MPTYKPNMVIVKIQDTLVSFPLAENGTIFDGDSFESTYNISDSEIVFSCFDEKTTSSIELVRYDIAIPNVSITQIYLEGDFPELVLKLLENHDIIKDYTIDTE